jgi:hypothetical protein
MMVKTLGVLGMAAVLVVLLVAAGSHGVPQQGIWVG